MPENLPLVPKEKTIATWTFNSLQKDYFHLKIYLAAPKGLFPPEPEHYRGPKLKVAIIGAGLAGMSTAVELLDQGHEIQKPSMPFHEMLFLFCWRKSINQEPKEEKNDKVDIYESRQFIGGKVGSFVDRRGNHIKMGLHVFFSCYKNLFRLLKRCTELTIHSSITFLLSRV